MWKKRKERLRREAEREELRRTFAALHKNEERLQMAEDPFYIEQLIFERASILSHCRALLVVVRQEEGIRTK